MTPPVWFTLQITSHVCILSMELANCRAPLGRGVKLTRASTLLDVLHLRQILRWAYDFKKKLRNSQIFQLVGLGMMPHFTVKENLFISICTLVHWLTSSHAGGVALYPEWMISTTISTKVNSRQSMSSTCFGVPYTFLLCHHNSRLWFGVKCLKFASHSQAPLRWNSKKLSAFSICFSTQFYDKTPAKLGCQTSRVC